MYFKLYSDTSGEMNVYIRPSNNQDCPLDDGEIIDAEEEELDLPFEFTMKVRRNEDGTRQDPKMFAYFPATELMHKDLVQALQDAGVDNLQTFPAQIREEGQDATNDDYFVVNVVGLMTCADEQQSDSLPLAGGQYFTNLVVDPSRTHGLLLFRLAESQLDVLVHEDVARRLGEREFPGLVLTSLKECV